MSEWVTTVGYIRSMKIGTLAVGARASGWAGISATTAAIDLSPYPDELSCDAIERRLVCTHCGAIGKVDARPNWTEHRSQPRSEARGWIQLVAQGTHPPEQRLVVAAGDEVEIASIAA